MDALVLFGVYRWPAKVLVFLGIVSLPFLLKVEHSGDLFSLNVRLRMLAPDHCLRPKSKGMPEIGPKTCSRYLLRLAGGWGQIDQGLCQMLS